MLWPFNHFRKPRLPPRGTIEAIYGMIVTQAREPSFYRNLGVPDTVNGRFDLLVLHLWMVLRRLRLLPGGLELTQALFDHFCADMDANLREMGVGDLAVPKKMRAFGEAFYGRAAAYDLALADGREALAGAICRNILDGGGLDNARRLASYVETAIVRLNDENEAALLGATWTFPKLLEERLTMTRTNSVDPWRAPIIVAQLPEIGVTRELTADKATREALANIAGLREVVSARAVFEVKPQSSGRVHVAGHLSARVGQTCVVTLDPIDNDIEEPIDLVFAPPEQIGQLVDRPDNEELERRDAEALDEMEPIENGMIDLGRLATDILYLAIDPYPRKPGAVFEPQIVADDPADHPFAALEALRRDAKGTKDE